ncbi:hypothetical protein [Bacillus multifaciens]|uniref:hypothetical protein n=1 Tax=Bacillus multifaciens TaxID=3068506 RepID=UPI0027428455|nr:hypothetical protein [Bacillus sp. WLY-B-L8]MDP7978172.1 hypothetical protein [Bacillus sp. WLY-B-L8]HDX9590128.1 hypothetical protein [Bacillus pseudomycoides]
MKNGQREEGSKHTVTLEKYITLRNAIYNYMEEKEEPITLLDIQQHITTEHEGEFAKKMLQQFYLLRLLDELKLDGKITLAEQHKCIDDKGVYYIVK